MFLIVLALILAAFIGFSIPVIILLALGVVGLLVEGSKA